MIKNMVMVMGVILGSLMVSVAPAHACGCDELYRSSTWVTLTTEAEPTVDSMVTLSFNFPGKGKRQIVILQKKIGEKGWLPIYKGHTNKKGAWTHVTFVTEPGMQKYTARTKYAEKNMSYVEQAGIVKFKAE